MAMATNGGVHKFNKNENNWLHKHFKPQQVDVVVSSIYIYTSPGQSECICLDSSFKCTPFMYFKVSVIKFSVLNTSHKVFVMDIYKQYTGYTKCT